MNPFKMRSMPSVLLSGALLGLSSCSDKSPEPQANSTETAAFQRGVPGGVVVETTTVTANVVSVFNSSREVILDAPGRERFTVKCGPEVVNFDQIRPGDQVKVTLTEEIAVSMAPESDPPDTAGVTMVALAPKGGQTGGVMASAKQVTATVTAIDMASHTATLQFPDGQTRRLKVRPDIDLSKRKVGEKVVIRKTDLMAIRLEKPKPQ